MTFTHLMNCFALTYGPIYAIYSGSRISDFQSEKLFGKSMLYYGMFAITKMVLYATIIPFQSDELNDTFNSTQELIRTMINAVEIIFLFYAFEAKSSFSENESGLKVLTVALGWSLADSLCLHLFYFLMNATGEEFTWEYIQVAIQANIDLIEKIAIVALIECIKKLNSEKKINGHIIIILLGKYAFNGLGFQYIKQLNFTNSWEKIMVKIVIAIGFGMVSKIIFRMCNKTEEERAMEEYKAFKGKKKTQ